MTTVYVAAIQEELAEVKCVFDGCDLAPVGIFHTPQGCYCHKDKIQALCAQHLVSMQGGPCTTLIDFKRFYTAVYDNHDMTFRLLTKDDGQ